MASKISVRDLTFYYGDSCALDGVSIEISPNSLTVISGPSEAGKSTLLRALNRMNDAIPHHRVEGTVLLDGVNIYTHDVDPMELRRRVGMVFRKSKSFAGSVYEELARRLKNSGMKKENDIRARIEASLWEAMLWDEIGDNLEVGSEDLSDIQSAKLCVARTLAHEPEVLLLDEPLDNLDEDAARVMEKLIENLKSRHTVLMTTKAPGPHRIADSMAYLESGTLKPIDI